MHLRGWFVGSVPLNVIADWIGNSDQRAKLVANIASAGSAEPSPLARHLLSTFEDDEDVSAALAAEFLSGSWSGPASGRYALLISQLESWRNNRGELVAVKRWAGRLIEDLQRSRDESLQREAERQW
jgi:membrane peptidoglycan carboxypeptidase